MKTMFDVECFAWKYLNGYTEQFSTNSWISFLNSHGIATFGKLQSGAKSR